MSSDVCKHCTEAGCLDACPTGALFRTEFGTVVVQEDICNGCGYCVVSCPFGVLDQREDDGRVWKCTLCYDRLQGDMEPACAQACPTDSIQFGELDELRERAARAGRGAARARARARRASTARTPRTASAASAPSSCCSTSRRPTGCRPTRWCRPRTPARSGRRPAAAAATMAAGIAAGFVGRPEMSPKEKSAGPARAADHLLRPADRQVAGLEAGDPLLLLLRRPGGRLRRARRDRDLRRPAARSPGAPGPAPSSASPSARCC